MILIINFEVIPLRNQMIKIKEFFHQRLIVFFIFNKISFSFICKIRRNEVTSTS